MTKPEKLAFSDFLDSMTSFYINKNFEDRMESEQKNRLRETKKIYKNIETISTYEGLKSYICEEKNSLHNLTSLLGLSEENFKRIVSMIRRNKDEKFTSEWSINETRKKMMSDEYYMKEICELLLGEKDYSKDIPRFILDQLLIDAPKLKAFSTGKVLSEMIKKAFKGTYSAQVGREVENLVEKILQEHISNEYECRKKVFDRNIDFVIPNVQTPKILIEVSYMVTTGSGQSTKRETMINVAQAVSNRNMHDNDQLIFINIIDGAGWLARQKDLERIYTASDYVLNLKTLRLLGDILDFYCK